MNKRAKKHLEIALGGNMNIATLKPLALIEIMTDFAKKEVEAISVTRCSTQLKSVDVISFEEWKKVFVVHVKDNLFELRGSMLSSETLRFAYSKDIELYNSLIV